jgi:dihydroorotate dehydrogenase
MYKTLRDILFRFDAEQVHGFSMGSFGVLRSLPVVRGYMKKTLAVPELPVDCFGLRFRNPVGLAAGFDKNAVYLDTMDLLGFGHVEVGTVTPMAQAGNERPRLFRLPKDQAIINRMGFNNDGMEAVAARLGEWRNKHPDTPLVIGGNIGKNKWTDNDQAWMDYGKCFQALHAYVDYFVVNVSSPNTPGLRALQERPALERIFAELFHKNAALPRPKPILLKIAPDLGSEQLQEIASMAIDLKLAGLVATNTTISREGLVTDKEQVNHIGAGGLSGRPLRIRSNEVLRELHAATGGKIPLVGSGGIFNGKDAQEKMSAGASMVQVWTGFIYEGPAIVKNIVRELATKTHRT